MKPSTLVLRTALLLAACVAFGNTTHADTIIDNIGEGSSGRLGVPAIAQTFTVPLTDSVLVAFSLEVEASVYPDAFMAHVAEWDTTNDRIGPLLYSSLPVEPNRSHIDEVAFDPGSLALTPGETYAIVGSAPTNAVSWGLRNAPGYLGGRVYHAINIGSIEWVETPFDMAFAATFREPVAVPEPATWALLGVGVILALALRARRGPAGMSVSPAGRVGCLA